MGIEIKCHPKMTGTEKQYAGGRCEECKFHVSANHFRYRATTDIKKGQAFLPEHQEIVCDFCFPKKEAPK